MFASINMNDGKRFCANSSSAKEVVLGCPVVVFTEVDPMKSFYIIYKITNLLNGMIYIGAHSTNDLKDKYMGSGKHIKRAIQKHGKENFIKEIICVCSCIEEMYGIEYQLVDESFCKREDTYNLVPGGMGGISQISPSKETRDKRSKAMTGRKLTEDHKKKIGKGNSGKVRSEESKEKLRIKRLGKKHSPEHIQKSIKSRTGLKRSQTAIENMKHAAKIRAVAYPVTDKTKNKISKSNTGKKHPGFKLYFDPKTGKRKRLQPGPILDILIGEGWLPSRKNYHYKK